MTPPPQDRRPLAVLGTFFLGIGLTARLLVAESSGPAASAAPTIFLAMGAATVLLERGLRGGRSFAPVLLLLPLLVVPGFFPLEARSVARGIDLVSAILVGLALRDLVLNAHLRAALLRSLLATGLFMCVLALAQTLYQREQLQEALDRVSRDASAAGRLLPGSATFDAFASSRRAAATLPNPNIFGGFMLLLLPLLATAIGAARPRAIAWALLALASAGAICSGSAGALLAFMLGAGALLLLGRGPPKLLRRMAMLLLVAGVCGVGLLVLALEMSWDPPLLGSKVTTFMERLSYRRLAFELLPSMGWQGIGLESFGPLARAHVWEGVSWSHYVHDSYLQLLLECGPVVLLALLPLGLSLRRLAREQPTEEAPAPLRAEARALQAGTLAGAGLAALLSPLITLMPLGWPPSDMALVTLLTTVGGVGGFLFLLRGLEPSSAALGWALAVGVSAFLLHNFVDFDLYSAGAALTLATVLAMWPMGRVTHGVGMRICVGLLGFVLLAAPIAIGSLALHRIAVRESLRPAAPGEARKTAPLFAGPVPDLDALPAVLSELTRGLRAREAERILAGLDPLLRSRPQVQLAEARYLSERAQMGKTFGPEALERLEDLRTPSQRWDAEILFRRFQVELSMGAEEADATALQALHAAAGWNTSDEDAPFLSVLREHLRK